jgi:adenine-specific DNA-methyltransferase
VRARALRASASEAEQRLWRHLRNRQMLDCKFRRQHPVGPFIADFASLEAGLVIEIDGGQHFEPEAQVADERRTAFLEAAGFRVLRFDNRQVLTETESVLAAIHQWLRSNAPHPSPLPPAGEGARPKDTP